MERYLQRRTKIKTPEYVKYKCSLENGESSFREKRIAAITNPLIIPALIRLKKILSTRFNLLIEYRSNINAVNIHIKLKITSKNIYLSSEIKEPNL
jgi:hypothetical protein